RPYTSIPIPPPSAPKPPPSAPRPARSEPTPNASEANATVPPLDPPPRAEVRFDAAPRPVLALLVALLLVPVRLDSVLIGADAPDDPSDAPVPTAACDRPVLDDDPGVDKLCRACGTEDINCEDVV